MQTVGKLNRFGVGYRLCLTDNGQGNMGLACLIVWMM